MGWVVNATPQLLYLRSSTYFIARWVGRRAGLDGCGKSHPRDSTPGPFIVVIIIISSSSSSNRVVVVMVVVVVIVVFVSVTHV